MNSRNYCNVLQAKLLILAGFPEGLLSVCIAVMLRSMMHTLLCTYIDMYMQYYIRTYVCMYVCDDQEARFILHMCNTHCTYNAYM